jgi:hypothetical protein
MALAMAECSLSVRDCTSLKARDASARRYNESRKYISRSKYRDIGAGGKRSFNFNVHMLSNCLIPCLAGTNTNARDIAI